MFVTVKFEIPVNEYEFIKEGIQLEVIKSWNEYDGFIAVRYGSMELYFNQNYFNVPVLITN